MALEEELSHSGRILENCAIASAQGSPITITKSMFYSWKQDPPHWAWMINPDIRKAAFAHIYGSLLLPPFCRILSGIASLIIS
jgi:hypothetical protein